MPTLWRRIVKPHNLSRLIPLPPTPFRLAYSRTANAWFMGREPNSGCGMESRHAQSALEGRTPVVFAPNLPTAGLAPGQPEPTPSTSVTTLHKQGRAMSLRLGILHYVGLLFGVPFKVAGIPYGAAHRVTGLVSSSARSQELPHKQGSPQ